MDTSSIDKTEIDKFKNLAKEWWKHDGKFKTLHKFNPVRLEYIINTIKDHYSINQKNQLCQPHICYQMILFESIYLPKVK